MSPSSDRILTTHTGSLPRPAAMLELVLARERGEEIDPKAYEATLEEAVHAVVRRQIETGIDIVGDGEMSKPSYATYVKDRLTGFADQSEMAPPADLLEFPDFAARMWPQLGLGGYLMPACCGEVHYAGGAALSNDLARMRHALDAAGGRRSFITAASPGVIALFLEDHYYFSTERDYLWALGEAMRTEYERIVAEGFVLQLDCPDLAAGRHTRFAGASLEAFRSYVARNIEVLDHAVANIPPERMRMHACWGNYEGPHHLDVPLEAIVDLLLKARPAGLSIESANPRHAHEWEVWRRVRLPDDKVLLPGVIDVKTNYIEAPDLVAQRLVQFARIVGRERVVASTDCGFATFAGMTAVDPEIAWAKLASLVEGARRASESS